MATVVFLKLPSATVGACVDDSPGYAGPKRNGFGWLVAVAADRADHWEFGGGRLCEPRAAATRGPNTPSPARSFPKICWCWSHLIPGFPRRRLPIYPR